MNQPLNEDLHNLLRRESATSSKSLSNQQSPLISPERKFMGNDLKKLDDLLGTLSVEKDGMINYVANDFEDKLRSSFLNKSSASIGTKQEFLNELAKPKKDFFQPDIMLLEDIETEAELIAKSLNIMMKNISDFVQHVSKFTKESVNSYHDYLCTVCDSIDVNIKKMYQIMAKCEELSIQMKPIKQLQMDIEKVNKLLDLLDKELDAKTT